jgi:hypothetical protein
MSQKWTKKQAKEVKLLLPHMLAFALGLSVRVDGAA